MWRIGICLLVFVDIVFIMFFCLIIWIFIWIIFWVIRIGFFVLIWRGYGVFIDIFFIVLFCLLWVVCIYICVIKICVCVIIFVGMICVWIYVNIVVFVSLWGSVSVVVIVDRICISFKYFVWIV